MAKLTFQDKQTLEKLLEMQDGYPSDFSNRTLQLFIGDFFNIDIYDGKYSDNGDSKAKRLRTLFDKESELVVATIIEGLLEHQIAVDLEANAFNSEKKTSKDHLYQQTRELIARLKGDSLVENIESIKPVTDDMNFTLLAESVRKSIELHKPIEALDRLHTYMVRYSKDLCKRHKLTFTKDEPLHALFGKYAKHLKDESLVNSQMTFKILGNATQQLDKYNDTRNNESLAHDNELVNDNEAILILNSIANLIRFVDQLDKELNVSGGKS